MRCTGAQADVAAQPMALGVFDATSERAKFGSSCTGALSQVSSRCLITICSGTVVLKDSKVSRVRNTSLDGVVCVSGSSKLEAYTSEFVWNNATALACFGCFGSRVAHNYVPQSHGGGVVAYDSSKVVITGRSSIHNNTALSGGGLAALGNATVFISGSSRVFQNVAGQNGGGALVYNYSSLTVAQNSSVHSNKAVYGGGVCAVHNATVTISGGSKLHNSTATSGGGLLAAGDASVAISGGSMVHSNLAHHSGGGVAALGMSVVTLTGSSVFGNIAVGRPDNPGGGLLARDSARVTLTNSMVHANSASTGAGIRAFHKARVTVASNSSLHSNSARLGGGGLCASETSSVVVTGNSSIHGNNGSNAGGGALVFGSVNLTLSGGSTIHNNLVGDGSGGGLDMRDNATAFIMEGSSIHNNTCNGRMGGGVSVGLPLHTSILESIEPGGLSYLVNEAVGTQDTSNAVFHIINSTIANNTSTRTLGNGGGLAMATNATAILINGTRVVGNRAANTPGGGAAVSSNGTLRVEPGVVFANNSAGEDADAVGRHSCLSQCDISFAAAWSSYKVQRWCVSGLEGLP